MIAIFPEIAGAAAQLEIEKASYLVRKYFGGSQAYKPQISVTKLSESIGIPVMKADLNEKGALVVKDVGGRFSANIIVSAEVNNKLELSFLVGHLLGHFYLHAQPYIVRGEWENTGFREPFSPLMRFQQNNYIVVEEEARASEMQADLFAASLMLPKVMLKRAMEKLKTSDALSTFFAVSTPFLNRRLELCGLKDQGAPGDFQAAESMMDPTLSKSSMHKQNLDLQNEPNSSAPKVNPPQTAVARVQRKMAVSGYSTDKKREHNQESDQNSQKNSTYVQSQQAGKSHPLEKSLKMFRKLANRLDDSVKSDDG